MTERIKGAAILYGKQNACCWLPAPKRHHDVIAEIRGRGWRGSVGNQGFVTSEGRFVDRKEACLIARAAGQLKAKNGPADVLFSEDLW